MAFDPLDLKTALLVLTGLAFVSGIVAAIFAVLATFTKGRRDPIIDAMQPSNRADEYAAVSTAQYYSFKAGDEARLLKEAARSANQLNRWAVGLTILSATLSAVAGFISALAA